MVSNNVLKDIQRLISITNTGLAFSKDPFDQERYQDIREILQDLVRETTDLNSQELSDLFRPTNYYDTPLIDVRAWIVKDRKLCLVKGQGEETWALPGGFGEVGYSPKENILKEIQEEHTDPELIREALKEAVFNRKTNWNYIKGVLRNWKLSGITTKIQVEERRLEHQGKKQHHQVSDDFKTGMDAARQLWGGQ